MTPTSCFSSMLCLYVFKYSTSELMLIVYILLVPLWIIPPYVIQYLDTAYVMVQMVCMKCSPHFYMWLYVLGGVYPIFNLSCAICCLAALMYTDNRGVNRLERTFLFAETLPGYLYAISQAIQTYIIGCGIDVIFFYSTSLL